MLQAMIYRSSY